MGQEPIGGVIEKRHTESPACARSHFRAGLYPLNRGRAPPALGAKRTTAGPAGGGGVADQLWGRVGSSGLASARVWLTGVRALPFSGRTLSLGGGPVNRGRASGRAGGCSFCGSAMGSRRRERARESARRALRPVRAPIFRPDFIP